MSHHPLGGSTGKRNTLSGTAIYGVHHDTRLRPDLGTSPQPFGLLLAPDGERPARRNEETRSQTSARSTLRQKGTGGNSGVTRFYHTHLRTLYGADHILQNVGHLPGHFGLRSRMKSGGWSPIVGPGTNSALPQRNDEEELVVTR